MFVSAPAGFSGSLIIHRKRSYQVLQYFRKICSERFLQMWLMLLNDHREHQNSFMELVLCENRTTLTKTELILTCKCSILVLQYVSLQLLQSRILVFFLFLQIFLGYFVPQYQCMDSTKKGNNSEKAVHSPTGQGIETGRSTRTLSATFASERLMPLLCQIYLYSSILAIIRASVFLPGISCPRNHIQKKMLLLGDV